MKTISKSNPRIFRPSFGAVVSYDLAVKSRLRKRSRAPPLLWSLFMDSLNPTRRRPLPGQVRTEPDATHAAVTNSLFVISRRGRQMRRSAAHNNSYGENAGRAVATRA